MRNEIPRRRSTLLLALPSLVAILSLNLFQSESSRPLPELHLVHCSGSPYNRGIQHGTALRKEIGELILLWKNDLQRSTRRNPDSVLVEFLRYTNFLPAIRRWTPELLEELNGLAKGASQDFETMYAFQLIDELWVYLDQRTNDHCSALGVAKNPHHPTLIAQNLDLEGFRHGYQTLLHIAQEGNTPEQYIFTIAGVLAANGMNNRSIGVCVNTLMQLSACSDGLPVDFVVRGILSARTEKEALDFMRSVKHASGQNYLIGFRDRIVNYEASGKSIVEFKIPENSGVVYHTNHPLTNTDWKPWYKRWKESISPAELQMSDSYVRFTSLEKRLLDSATVIDESTIRRILQSKDSGRSPLCRPYRPGVSVFTFGSLIMNLSEKPSLLLSAGPPDAYEYVRFEFQTK